MAYALPFTLTNRIKTKGKKSAMAFKRCSLCGKHWPTKESFLEDNEVRLDGYKWDHDQVMSGMPAEGMVVFTHSPSVCGTSITIPAILFKRDGHVAFND